MRVAFVVPRYGSEVIGGAEHAARMLAERLALLPGHAVEVLTTCAVDARTWEDAYRPGASDLHGVSVTRFSARGRHPRFDVLSAPALAGPRATTWQEQRQFIVRQGPVSADLEEAVAGCRADVVVFYPYLYATTVFGLPRVAGRGVLHPAAHDEPALWLPVFDSVFRAASGLVYQTSAERHLVARRFAGLPARFQLDLGLGVDVPSTLPAPSATPVDGRPYVCCLGRVEDGKGTRLLARYFAAYKRRRPGPLALVLAGPVVDPPPSHRDVVVLGRVDEAVKWQLLGNAELLLSPSAYEAFSLALVEAWALGTPAMVNAACPPTFEQVSRSGGGMAFDGYASFEAGLDRLLGDPGLRAALGAAGKRYVETRFAWPALMRRYARFLGGVAQAAAR